jgi:hypothetical protein
LDPEQYRKMWEELLRNRGLEEFGEVAISGRNYLRTNYRISEPDGKERTEKWIIGTKDSVSPSDIVDYNALVRNKGYDFGVLVTPSTITGSAFHVLIESAPYVRVYDYGKFTDLLRQSPEIAEKYGVPIEEVLPKETNTFLQKIKGCAPGKEAWKEYQDLMEEIFCYLFVPPLNKPEPQHRAEDGLDIRDLIFPNHTESGFWAEVRSEYKGSYIVVEAKNKVDLDKNDVSQLSGYLHEKQLGLFGILLCRKVSQPAIDERRAAYTNPPHRMIVLIADVDLIEMLIKKARGENPEDVLRDRTDLYRMKYRF